MAALQIMQWRIMQWQHFKVLGELYATRSCLCMRDKQRSTQCPVLESCKLGKLVALARTENFSLKNLSWLQILQVRLFAEAIQPQGVWNPQKPPSTPPCRPPLVGGLVQPDHPRGFGNKKHFRPRLPLPFSPLPPPPPPPPHPPFPFFYTGGTFKFRPGTHSCSLRPALRLSKLANSLTKLKADGLSPANPLHECWNRHATNTSKVRFAYVTPSTLNPTCQLRAMTCSCAPRPAS